MAAPLPLAAGLDWLEGLLPLLFLLFWVVSQVRALFGRGDRGRAAGPEMVRPAPRPVPRQPAPDDEAHRELLRQIEEFVREPSGRGRAAPRQAPRTLDRDAERRRPREQPPLEPPPRPRAAKPRTPVPAQRTPAVPSPAPTQPPALGSLGGHAADVARHVNDAFAHEIEHLPRGLAQPAAAAPTAAGRANATDLVALLRNPATLRQLVIVREVLERPVDRW